MLTYTFFETLLNVITSHLLEIATLLMSIVTLMNIVYKERFSLDIKCDKIILNFSHCLSPYALHLTFINCSVLPLSIHKIDVIFEGITYNILSSSSFIYDQQIGLLNESEIIKCATTPLPLTINGCSSYSGFFRVPLHSSAQNVYNSEIMLTIHTNKRCKKYRIQLSQAEFIMCDLEKMEVVSRSLKSNI